MAERTGDMERYEIVLSNLGNLAVWLGNYDKGERLLAEALQLGRRRGYHYRIEAVQFYLGFACANRGDFKSAKAHFEEGIRTHNEIGAEQFLSGGYCSYSLSSHYDGDQQAAEVMARNALTVTRKLGDARREGEALVCLGHALAAQDRLDEATSAYAQGVALHRTLEHTRHSLEALAGLAHVADRKGETDSALSYLEEILQDLASNQSVATEESFRVYHTCYQLLRQHEDPRAPALLQLAHEQLHKRAATITDAGQQELFWAMPGHRAVDRDWHALNSA